MFVLNFLREEDFKNFLDTEAKKVIEYLLKKVLFSQPELKDNQKDTNIQMTKEFLEQWIIQGLNLEGKGAGNYPIDVFSKKDKFGIDVKFVSAEVDDVGNFKKNISNETSLAQNFAKEGNDLDYLFKEEKFDEILKRWQVLLENKFKKALIELELEKIYYFIFIRGGNSISLAIAEVRIDRINSLEVKRSNDKSVFVKNYLDDKYGEVKIYKSKKRMELRFFPKQISEDRLLYKWDFNNIFKPQRVNLREIINDKEKFNKLLQKEFENIFFKS